MIMRVSVIHPADLGDGEIVAWRAMQRGSRSLLNPFLCTEFVTGVGRVRANSRVAVLTDGPEILGFFPFERRGLRVGMPIGAGLSNCQGLIHVPALDWDAREILRACKLSAWQFDNLVQDQAPFQRYAAAQAPVAAISLADGFETYHEKLKLGSARFLKDLARKSRALERDLGEIRIIPDTRDMGALRTLMGWKSDQCRRNGWLDVFDRPWVVELIDHLFASKSDLFSSPLSMLYAGETPVAGQLGLRCGRYFAGWFTAYNASFGGYSPGLIQVTRLTEKLADAGVELIDMGGTAPYQNKLKSHDIYFTRGMVTSGPLSAVAHRARAASAAWARRRVRQFPPLYRAAGHALRRAGRVT